MKKYIKVTMKYNKGMKKYNKIKENITRDT